VTRINYSEAKRLLLTVRRPAVPELFCLYLLSTLCTLPNCRHPTSCDKMLYILHALTRKFRLDPTPSINHLQRNVRLTTLVPTFMHYAPMPYWWPCLAKQTKLTRLFRSDEQTSLILIGELNLTPQHYVNTYVIIFSRSLYLRRHRYHCGSISGCGVVAEPANSAEHNLWLPV
jgi:hypothetical protein